MPNNIQIKIDSDLETHNFVIKIEFDGHYGITSNYLRGLCEKAIESLEQNNHFDDNGYLKRPDPPKEENKDGEVPWN